MDYTNKTFCLEVKGEYACFTRPEMKVERVSYDVITPSAVRAIFTAIFWKPAIKWNVKKIEVLKPIRWISIRRNEVGKVASTSSNGILIEDERQQRAGLLLRDVAYRIYAELEFINPLNRPKIKKPVPDNLVETEEKQEWGKDENPGKYNAMFERRATKGQCFNQPYLGCREFSCAFRFIPESEIANEKLKKPAIEDSKDLGFMLYDMDFTDEFNIKPAFFRATMKNGSILIPDWESDAVHK